MLTKEKIIDLTESIDINKPGCFIRVARAIESAVRSQDEALLRQARGALQSCSQSGYVDIDGDFQRTMRFDRGAVSDALSALNARLGDSNQEKSDASK